MKRQQQSDQSPRVLPWQTWEEWAMVRDALFDEPASVQEKANEAKAEEVIVISDEDDALQPDSEGRSQEEVEQARAVEANPWQLL